MPGRNPFILDEAEEDSGFDDEDSEDGEGFYGRVKINKETNVFMMNYRSKTEFIETHDTSNVVVALFTTSAARLKLYNAMQKVVETPGCELLYTDTDSLIFACPEGVPVPLETGEFLGDLTDEYPRDEILVRFL